LGTWIALALAGALIAGCGGGGSTTTSAHSTSTPAAASSTPSTSSSSSTKAPGAGSVPNVQAAVEACKKTIQAQKTLPAPAKAKLEAVCGKAAKGDTAAVHKAAQEVCEEVIENSAVHAGSAREQALAACKTK
jgi:hypothetical protein